jgi:hypothetical protein
MTILGVPDGSGFTLGTSSNIAPATGGASNNGMNMSLGKLHEEYNPTTTEFAHP